MMYIKLMNSGGTLDTRTARNDAEAAKIAIELIRECGELRNGDQIIIEGDEEEDE